MERVSVNVSLVVAMLILILHPLTDVYADEEADSLLSFKQSVKDPYNELISWDSGNTVGRCTWDHIVCNSTGGNVTRIDLRLVGLSGPASFSALTQLSQLKYLILAGNSLTGTVPDNVTNIPYVDLTGNPLLNGPCTQTLCDRT